MKIQIIHEQNNNRTQILVDGVEHRVDRADIGHGENLLRIHIETTEPDQLRAEAEQSRDKALEKTTKPVLDIVRKKILPHWPDIMTRADVLPDGNVVVQISTGRCDEKIYLVHKDDKFFIVKKGMKLTDPALYEKPMAAHAVQMVSFQMFDFMQDVATTRRDPAEYDYNWDDDDDDYDDDYDDDDYDDDYEEYV